MPAPNPDRRSNLVLRALIDDMLERVRELNRNSAIWTDEERERAEAELEGVMARVRRIAGEGSKALGAATW
jgi:DNA-binding SARP family transcriptional activator